MGRATNLLASLIFISLNAIPAFNNNSLNYVHLILGMFVLVMSAWVFSTISLGKQFDTLNGENEESEIQAKAEKGEVKN